jgi:hypothetical protein
MSPDNIADITGFSVEEVVAIIKKQKNRLNDYFSQIKRIFSETGRFVLCFFQLLLSLGEKTTAYDNDG